MSKNKKILIISIILGSLMSTINIGAMKRKNNKKPKNPETEINTSKINKQEEEKKEDSNKKDSNEEEDFTTKISKQTKEKYKQFKISKIPDLTTAEQCKEFLSSLNEIHGAMKQYQKFGYNTCEEIRKTTDLFFKDYDTTKQILKSKIEAIDKKKAVFLYNKKLEDIKNTYKTATSEERINYDKLILLISKNLNKSKDFVDKIILDINNNLNSISETDFLCKKIKNILDPVLTEINQIIDTSKQKIKDLEKLKQNQDDKYGYTTTLDKQNIELCEMENYYENINSNKTNEENKEFDENKKIESDEKKLFKINTNLDMFKEIKYKDLKSCDKKTIDEQFKKIDNIKKHIEKRKEEINKIKNQINKYFKELEEIEKNIKEKNKDLTSTNFDECTKLTNQIDNFIIKNLEEFKNNEEMIKKLKDLKKKSDKIKEINKSTQKKKEEYVKIKSLLDNNINLLNEIKDNYKNFNFEEIKDCKNTLDSLHYDLENIKEFAKKTKINEIDKSIESLEKEIKNFNNLLEKRKKEIENNINKIENNISSYNETLNNIKNNINNKNLDFDIKKIYKNQQNLETIKSFIKEANEFADQIENKNLKNKLKKLSKNLSNVQNLIGSTIKIKEIEKEISLYSTNLKLIEEDYIDYNLEKIMEEEKVLSSINNFINKSMEFVKDKKNKEIINNLSNFSKNVNYIQNLLEKRKKEIKNINKIKNNISSYNETLNNIKNNNSNFDVKKIHKAQQNLETIKSFIKEANEFADKIKNENLKNEIENLSKNLSDVQNLIASTIKIKEIETEIALHSENLKSIEENYSKYSPEEIAEEEKVLSSTVSFLKESMEFVKNKQNNEILEANNEILNTLYNLAENVDHIQNLLDARKKEIKNINKIKNKISYYNETLNNTNYDDISNYEKFKEIEQKLNSTSSFIKEANEFADQIKNKNLKNEIENLSDKIFKINNNSSSKNIEDFEDIFSISKNIEKFKTFNYKNENSNLENKEKNIDKEIENSLKPIKEFFEKFNNEEIEKQIKIYEEYLDSAEKTYKSYNLQEINDTLTLLIGIKNNLDNFSKFAEENTKGKIQKLEEKIEKMKNLILNETKFSKDMELIYSKLNNKK